ncbi:MAG TPA: prolyl oligopeptidase family serine peptidase [Solimonas sp.]|nr:prolyl oligopeptidase family serine peptidase [Solimonas sp.]
MELPKPKQWEVLSLVPILAGLYWLLAEVGLSWWLWALVPGGLLLASGLALLLMPGDPRILGLMALGSVLGVLLAIPAWWSADTGTVVLAVAGSVASFLACGRAAVLRAPVHDGAVPPVVDRSMDLKVGLDEAVLGYFVCTARLPSGDMAAKACEEAGRLEAALASRGWLDDASGFHPAPTPPKQTYVHRARLYGHGYEVLRFDSGYDPDPDLPGAQAWKLQAANDECEVRILRHPGPPRPWLMCIHGYRMGMAWMDFGLFPPGYLHHRLGFNLVMPVLPLHGTRRVGLRSGDRYLDGDPLDLVYAQAQALWDLRRTIAWLRATEERPRIGVYGVSLGGYNTALLANYETGLDFAVAGIPVVDFSYALWRFLPPMHAQYFAARGLDEARYERILSVVSPLTRTPQLAREHLHIVAATADRIVVPHHPVRLSRHWQVPVTWYQGSHLSIRREREVREVLRLASARAGWREDGTG